MNIDYLLSQFDGVEDAPDGGWLCLCPVHGDSNPSLKISLTDGGMVLLVCRSHDCCFADIVAAVRLTAADFRGVDPGTARTIREASSKSPANATDLAQLEALVTQLADGYMNSESSTYGWDRWNIDEDDAAASSVIVAYVQTDHGARARGIASSLIDGTSDGFERLEPYDLIGSHSIGTGEFRLNDYFAPRAIYYQFLAKVLPLLWQRSTKRGHTSLRCAARWLRRLCV